MRTWWRPWRSDTTSATRRSGTSGRSCSRNSCLTASATTSRACASPRSWRTAARASTSHTRRSTASSSTARRPRAASETPEGWVVRYADKIAYLHHDIDDAMRAGIIAEADLPIEVRIALGKDRGDRLDTMIYDVIVASYGKPEVTMSEEVLDATNSLRK